MSRMYTSPAAGERESGRDTNARARRGRVAGAGGARCGSEGTGLADGGRSGHGARVPGSSRTTRSFPMQVARGHPSHPSRYGIAMIHHRRRLGVRTSHSRSSTSESGRTQRSLCHSLAVPLPVAVTRRGPGAFGLVRAGFAKQYNGK